MPNDTRPSLRYLLSIVMVVCVALTGCRETKEKEQRKAEPSAARNNQSSIITSTTPDGTHRCKQSSGEGFFLDRVDGDVFVMTKAPGTPSAVPMKNISWIDTTGGTVVIDTGVPQSARIAKKLIDSTSGKPVSTIIYTHHHGTQVLGTPILKQASTKVIAQEDLVTEFERAGDMLEYFNLINSIQFDVEPVKLGKDADFRVLLPDITYSSKYDLVSGTTEIFLYHADGEASDYSIVFKPAGRIVWTADMTGVGVPNVASPMKPVRDPVKWKKAIEFIKSLSPEVMIDGVSHPLCDKKKIMEQLDARIAYLDFLHRAVSAELNKGSTLEATVANTKLPPDLASNPFLQDLYLSHEFNVRGVYGLYSGWFDRNGTHLNPVPSAKSAAVFLMDMGGAARVLARAEEFRKKGELGMALEYLDLLISVGEHAPEAHKMKSDILMELSRLGNHRMTADIYRRLAKMERAESEKVQAK